MPESIELENEDTPQLKSLAALTVLALEPQFSLFKGILNPLHVRCNVPMHPPVKQQGSLQEIRLLANPSGQWYQSLYFLDFQESRVHEAYTENDNRHSLRKNKLSLLINLEE